MIGSSKKLTWQLPDGSIRYNCGPASSYAANRVDVPNGLHTWHSRLKASLSHPESAELQTACQGERANSDRHALVLYTHLAYQYRLKTCTKLATLSARTWPGMMSP